MKAMLLAAGEGTRFRPQTLKTPKPALPLLNVPLGFYSFPFLKSVGVDSLVVNTFHLPNLIEKLYKSQNHFKTSFSHETEKILGSGGGLEKAKGLLSSEKNFLLMNADEVFIPENENFLNEMKTQHLKSHAISTLLVMKHPEVGSKFGGIWVDAKGTVVGFGKTKPAEAVRGYHYLGVQILNNEIFNFLQPNEMQNILYDNLTRAQKAGHKVEIFETSGKWFETGNLGDYLLATESLIKTLKSESMKSTFLSSFYKEYAPHSALKEISGALIWQDHSANIDGRCQFKDFAVVGANSQLEACQLSRAVIGNNLILKDTKINSDLIL